MLYENLDYKNIWNIYVWTVQKLELPYFQAYKTQKSKMASTFCHVMTRLAFMNC